MKKKVLSYQTIICIVACVIIFILLITMGTISGKIIYDSKTSPNVWTFTFDHIITGSNSFKYDVGEFASGQHLSQGKNVHEYGIVEGKVIAIPLTIVAYVQAFTFGIGACLSSSFVKNNNTKKKLLITCSIAILICAILVFITPIFAKKNMIEAIKPIYGGTSLEERYKDVQVGGTTFAGILMLLCSGLILYAALMKNKEQLKQLTMSNS